MASQALDEIVDSLSAGRIGVDDFMRAVEVEVYNLLPSDSQTSDTGDTCERRVEDGLSSR